jgi:phage-related protein
MPLDISAVATAEKNQKLSDGVFAVLLKVDVPSFVDPLYFCANTENIVWDSNTWIATSFDIDEIGENTSGDAPSFNIKVSNVNRLMESYIVQYDQWLKLNSHAAIEVTLYIVNTHNLGSAVAEFEYTADVLSYTADAVWVTFELGSSNLLNFVFPKDVYTANSCRWIFKSDECGYSGPEGTCRKTLSACTEYGNESRFGAFPSIDSMIKRVQLD